MNKNRKRSLKKDHPFITGNFKRPTPWNKKPLLAFSCAICKKVFETNLKNNKNIFCSKQCYWKSLKGKPVSSGSNHWNYSGKPISRNETRFVYSQMKEIAINARYKCQLCKFEFPDNPIYKVRSIMSFDHIIPIRLGGTHDVKNGQLLCRRCNSIKTRIDRLNIFHITKGT